MKRTILCRRLYVEDDEEHLCMLQRDHDEPCKGHKTSRSLVPEDAQKIVMPFVGTAYVWESESDNVFLAYAQPPLDILAQGKVGGGVDSAMFRLRRTIEADRYWEDESV